MAKKEDLELSQEEKELIMLRRIQAEEAKKTSETQEPRRNISPERREARRKAMLKKKKKKRVLAAITIIILIFALVGAIIMFVPGAKTEVAKLAMKTPMGKAFVKNMIGEDYEANIQNKDFDEDSVNFNSGLNLSEDYTNIALFGIDARGEEFSSDTHSDTIIILSINEKTGEMKMASVFRDTYLKIVCDDGTIYYDRANSAYYRGGPLCAINMLNENFDMNISDYIVVNFSGIANIVDALGGLELNIAENEIEYVNYYLAETRNLTGLDSPDLTESGVQKLSGVQVASYCRIRYTSFEDKETGEVIADDYGRTARQRYVLMQLIYSAKSSGLSGLLDTSKVLFSENTGDNRFVETSMNIDEAIDILTACLDLNFKETQGYPIERGSVDYQVVPKDLMYNTQLMHEFLFGTKDYKGTDNLKEVSDYIADDTGIYR